MSKAWKSAEREVARFFGGQRRIRVRYDEKVGDIIHPVYSIEVKYGRQIPGYLNVKTPTLLTVVEKRQLKDEIAHKKGEIGKQKVEFGQLVLRYFIIPSRCLIRGAIEISGSPTVVEKKIMQAKFLSEAMTQAVKYGPGLLPVVCVKPKRRRGFIAILKYD